MFGGLHGAAKRGLPFSCRAQSDQDHNMICIFHIGHIIGENWKVKMQLGTFLPKNGKLW